VARRTEMSRLQYVLDSRFEHADVVVNLIPQQSFTTYKIPGNLSCYQLYLREVKSENNARI
jgi:hypothetical protein